MSTELNQTKADQNWWKINIAEPLGLHLIGWSYRYSATFVNNVGQQIQLPSWFAEAIIEALKKNNTN